MASTAYPYRTRPSASARRDSAAVTGTTSNHDEALAELSPPTEPRVGRAAAIGASIGFVLVAVVVTVVGTLGGMGAGAAFGLAVFIGAWSGVGAGFMLAGTLSLVRHDDAVRAYEAVQRRQHAG